MPITPKEVTCPSCGATRALHNPGIVLFVCEYCGNSVYWDEDRLKDLGKQSILAEGFSRLYRGATGSLYDKRFVVLGRVRYSFGRGFWNEWFLEFQDGKTAWLSEDNHEFALETEASWPETPLFQSFKPGKYIWIGDTQFVVEKVGRAKCIGIEGNLPKVIQTGEGYDYVDGSSPDGKETFGIEYDQDPPTVFVGRWVSHAALNLDDEGQDW